MKTLSTNKDAIHMREWRKNNPVKAKALADKYREQRKDFSTLCISCHRIQHHKGGVLK